MSVTTLNLLNNFLVPPTIIVIRILGPISTLMMKGNSVLVVLRPSQTRTTCQGLLHLRLGARTASEVSVTTDRREGSGTGSKVMVRNGG